MPMKLKQAFFLRTSHSYNELSVIVQCFGSAWDKSWKPDEKFDETLQIRVDVQNVVIVL